MQLYGIGTALKILLGYKSPYKRNEIVALLNLFNKLSMSVDTFYQHKKGVILEHLVKSRDEFWIFFWLGGSGLALVYIVWQIDLKKKVKNKFVNVFPGKKMKGLWFYVWLIKLKLIFDRNWRMMKWRIMRWGWAVLKNRRCCIDIFPSLWWSCGLCNTPTQ